MSEVPIDPLEEEEPPDPFEPEVPISDGSEGEGPGPPDDPEMSIGWEDAEVSGDRINLFDAPIVAGTVDGARVEVREDGLHAYDSTGAETATIQGEGGEFVGGSFRTSDALPGQVVLADDAYVTHLDGGGTWPGMKVVPIDTTSMDLPAAIGPSANGLTVFGGRNTTGGSSVVQANPTASFMRTYHEGGGIAGTIQTSPTTSQMRTYHEGGGLAGEFQTSATASQMRTYREDGSTAGAIQTSATSSLMRTYREDGSTAGNIQTSATSSHMRTYSGNSSESGWVQVLPQDAELAYVSPSNTYFSRIRANANEAYLFTAAGGAGRYLTVDANGVWVKSGSKAYNLEETAQDSGWQSFPVRSGITANDVAWRNKGGVCHFKGTVSASWTSGWNTIVSGLPDDMTPASDMVRSGASSSTSLILRMSATGTLDVNFPAAYTGSIHISPLSYVLD